MRRTSQRYALIYITEVVVVVVVAAVALVAAAVAGVACKCVAVAAVAVLRLMSISCGCSILSGFRTLLVRSAGHMLQLDYDATATNSQCSEIAA